MNFDRNCFNTQEFQTLGGLRELALELAAKVHSRDLDAPSITYTVGARQLYALVRLASYAVALNRADLNGETPKEMEKLYAEMREFLESFWGTPLNDHVIRENW